MAVREGDGACAAAASTSQMLRFRAAGKLPYFPGAGRCTRGASLARALARVGVGQLDIVDAQWMETENTSRHDLGLADAGHGKARRLAEKIRQDVPGVRVRGFLDEASTWAT